MANLPELKLTECKHTTASGTFVMVVSAPPGCPMCELDAERAKHTAELATLKEANARLEAAVRELGKCGTCEGYGEYPIDETDPRDTMAVCSTCRGSKMHRTAIAALAPPQPTGDTSIPQTSVSTPTSTSPKDPAQK